MKNGEAPDQAVADKIKLCFGQMQKDSKAQMQQMFDKLPAEAIDCIKNKIGADKLEQLRAGTIEVTEEIGSAFECCTQGVMKQFESQFTNQLQQLPPQVQECITNKLGGDLGQKMQTGGLDQNAMQAIIKECASQMQQPQGMMPSQGGFSGGQMPPLPPQIKDCVVNKLGGDFEEKMKSGEIDPTKLQAVVKECASQMKPPGEMTPPSGGQIPGGMMPPEGQMPPAYPVPEGFQGGQIPPTGQMPPTGAYPTMPPPGGQIPEGYAPPTYPVPPMPTGYQIPEGYAPPSTQYPQGPYNGMPSQGY